MLILIAVYLLGSILVFWLIDRWDLEFNEDNASGWRFIVGTFGVIAISWSWIFCLLYLLGRLVLRIFHH